LHTERRPRRLDTVRGERQTLAADAEHLRHRGPVEVGVEDADAGAAERPRTRQTGGHGRLAHAALAGDDGDDLAHAGEALAEPHLLGLDLAHDVRTAVADDILVLFHRLRCPIMSRFSSHFTARLAARRRSARTTSRTNSLPGSHPGP